MTLKSATNFYTIEQHIVLVEKMSVKFISNQFVELTIIKFLLFSLSFSLYNDQTALSIFRAILSL